MLRWLERKGHFIRKAVKVCGIDSNSNCLGTTEESATSVVVLNSSVFSSLVELSSCWIKRETAVFPCRPASGELGCKANSIVSRWRIEREKLGKMNDIGQFFGNIKCKDISPGAQVSRNSRRMSRFSRVKKPHPRVTLNGGLPDCSDLSGWVIISTKLGRRWKS